MSFMMKEYQCADCEHVFEFLVITRLDPNYVNEDVPVCPKCGSDHCLSIIGNPLHHKHVSHSQWRVGHAD